MLHTRFVFNYLGKFPCKNRLLGENDMILCLEIQGLLSKGNHTLFVK